MNDTYTLVHPGQTPPSMNSNDSGYGSHWSVRRQTKQVWEDIIFGRLLQARVPRHVYDYVEVSAVLAFPTRQRRDAENYMPVLSKACGDVLVTMEVIPDDTPDHYRWTTLAFEQGPKSTSLTLEFRRADKPEYSQ